MSKQKNEKKKKKKISGQQIVAVIGLIAIAAMYIGSIIFVM